MRNKRTDLLPRGRPSHVEATSGAGHERDDCYDPSPVAPPPEPPAPVPTAPKKRKKSKSAVVMESGQRSVGMGSRPKLTRKAEASLADWHNHNRGRKLDEMVKAGVAAARERFGHRGVFHGLETRDLVVGIRVPSLAFEFLIGNSVFPCGVVIQVVGKEGTGKSGLVAEFIRWADRAGGFGVVNENETKFSPDWYESITGPEAFQRMQLNRCDSVESWQDHLTTDLKTYKRLIDGTKKEPGPGRVFPVLFAVDSIMGKMSVNTQEKIHTEGSAGRGFAIEALAISRYMRTVPQWLDDWPFTLVLTNHLRLKTDEKTGQELRDKAGGVLLNFQETCEIELAKIGPKRLECKEYDGFQIQMTCAKNSLGPTHRTVRTRVLWWEEPDEKTGDFKQRTIFDWDWATVQLLFSIINGGERNVRLRHHLKQVDFDMEFASPTAQSATAWSSALGVPKSSKLLWQEMGALIRQNADIMKRLRLALRIKNQAILKGDYSEQMTTLAGEMP